MATEGAPKPIRTSQPPLPRGVWILAIVVGLACAVFAVIIVATPVDRATTAVPSTPSPAKSRGGFGLGLGVGIGAGVVIGYALGRGRRKR